MRTKTRSRENAQACCRDWPEIKSAFRIDVCSDAEGRHPTRICSTCLSVVRKASGASADRSYVNEHCSKTGQSVEVKTACCVCVRENKLKGGRPRKLSSGKRGRPPSSDTSCPENVVTADKEKAVPDASPVAEVNQLKVSDLEQKAPQIAVSCISEVLDAPVTQPVSSQEHRLLGGLTLHSVNARCRTFEAS